MRLFFFEVISQYNAYWSYKKQQILGPNQHYINDFSTMEKFVFFKRFDLNKTHKDRDEPPKIVWYIHIYT